MSKTVQGDDLPAASNKRCAKARSKLTGREINTLKTGDQFPNLMADFLLCEASKNKNVEEKCRHMAASYAKCHAGVMGSGRNPTTGLGNCADEILQLLTCVKANQ